MNQWYLRLLKSLFGSKGGHCFPSFSFEDLSVGIEFAIAEKILEMIAKNSLSDGLRTKVFIALAIISLDNHYGLNP